MLRSHRILYSMHECMLSASIIDNHQYNTIGTYKFDLTTILQEVYHSILRGITRPDFCASHGRPVILPESARRFSIPDLVKMHDYVMHHATDENIRNWAYIIMSIGLFLHQDEAANLLLSSITPATNPNSGEPILQRACLTAWWLQLNVTRQTKMVRVCPIIILIL